MVTTCGAVWRSADALFSHCFEVSVNGSFRLDVLSLSGCDGVSNSGVLSKSSVSLNLLGVDGMGGVGVSCLSSSDCVCKGGVLSESSLSKSDIVKGQP